MDKEKMQEIKERLDLFPSNMNEPAQKAYCELFDYINNLEQQVKKQKEAINKIDNYINNYDVFKVFSFPLMKRWEEQQVKSSIDYEFKTSLVKDLKDILKEVSE